MPLIIRQSLFAVALQCSAGLLLLSGAAAAQTEVFTSSSLLGPTMQADDLALPSFNSDLGTLEKVVITLQFNICPTVTVNNSTTGALDFNSVVVAAPFSVTGPAGLTYSNTLFTDSISGTAVPGITDLKPATGWLYAVSSATGGSLTSWEDQSSGNIDLVVTPGNITTKIGASTAAGLAITSSAQEWENVSVTYTYLSTAAVPEPSGKYLAFIVGTMMVVFMMGRRMRIAG